MIQHKGGKNMEESLYTLLTDANARAANDVEQHLQNEFTAGAPWFD